jgi:formate C-acetyltransferase
MAEQKLWEASEMLSPRIRHLRDYYFLDEQREFQNNVMSFTTGVPNDVVYQILDFISVPDMLGGVLQANRDGLAAMAVNLELPTDFWEQPLVIRKALFFHRVLQEIPVDILDDELIVGGRFCTSLSTCLTAEKTEEFIGIEAELIEKSERILSRGLSCGGITPGHIIQNHAKVLQKGFRGIKEEAEGLLERTASEAKREFLKAIIICCDAIGELSHRYAEEARRLAKKERKTRRKEELIKIAEVCDWVPYNPARTFYEALQATWFSHMVEMMAESYPGPGVSHGRLDQYLYPFYRKDVDDGRLSREEAKELFQCFSIKHNYAYDYQTTGGPHGRNAGFGQLITLGGQGANGEDLTNDLTYLILESFQELNMLEPKLNLRIHSGTPKELLFKASQMIRDTQGSPFILNFDKIVIEALEGEGMSHDDAVDYGVVGCLENTAQGKDTSGTVDVHFNVAKSVELALNDGKDWHTGERLGTETGDPLEFESFEQVMEAYKQQLRATIQRTTAITSACDALRGKYVQCPFLSAVIDGCMEKGRDIRDGGAVYNFTTFNGVGIATAADSLAAIKKVVFEDKRLTMAELLQALRTNFEEKEDIRQILLTRAPKFGNDDDYVDSITRDIFRFWCQELSQYVTPTGKRFRAGYLSWNHFIHDGAFTAATPNGRRAGEPVSNGVCPSQGCDVKGPTAAIKSVAKLGFDLLPSGASHTMTINPTALQTDEQLDKFAALLRTYNELGGTSLQFNVIDAETLRDAQRNPESYQNLLVRVTGYNAYFVGLTRALQDEIISRIEHRL